MRKFLIAFVLLLSFVVSPLFCVFASGKKSVVTESIEQKKIDVGPVRFISNTPYHQIGLENAPVVMMDFYSLTCPACAEFHTTTLPKIIEEYVDIGVLRIEFYDFVSDQVAMIGSKTVRCLREDLFLSFTSFLMKEQGEWAYSQNPVEALKKRAKIFGMSDQRFDACLDDREMNVRILDAQKAMSEKIKITHTPTLIFYKKGQSSKDGNLKQGIQDFKTIQKIINSYLN